MNGSDASDLKILMVDDDENLLCSLRRQVHGKYTASCAASPSEALELFDKYGPFALVVSDMKMPGMSGIELIAEIRRRDPHAVTILLTGDGDVNTAARAVNESKVFRYLNKPCDSNLLLESIGSGLEHYRLATAEAELLSKTLSGSVRMLTEVLSMAMPEAFGLSQEAKSLTGEICRDLKVGVNWQAEMAAMLMRIGMVSIAPELAKRYLRGEKIEPHEWSDIKQSAQKGGQLVGAIPRLEPVGELIRWQYAAHDSDVPSVAKVLRVVGDFQRYSIGSTAFETVRRMEKDAQYDAAIVESLRRVVCQQFESTQTTVDELASGMILEEPICDTSSRLLLSEGTEMHQTLVERIQTIKANGTQIKEPIRVRYFKSAAETVPSGGQGNDPGETNLATATATT